MIFTDTMIENMSIDELTRYSYCINANSQFLTQLFTTRIEELESQTNEASDIAGGAEDELQRVASELEDAENEIHNHEVLIDKLENQIANMTTELMEANDKLYRANLVMVNLEDQISDLEDEADRLRLTLRYC